MKKEIEEKLKEIGYIGNTDLETILEALPEKIEGWVFVGINKESISYTKPHWRDPDYLSVAKQNNESLANTAARLLILLHEKGIVKFNN